MMAILAYLGLLSWFLCWRLPCLASRVSTLIRAWFFILKQEPVWY